jgi:hypothetical protein
MRKFEASVFPPRLPFMLYLIATSKNLCRCHAFSAALAVTLKATLNRALVQRRLKQAAHAALRGSGAALRRVD